MAASSLCGFLDIRAAVPLLLLAAVAFYVLMEQLSYRRKKGPLPGPPLVVPFFGSIAQLIRDPPAYWDGLAASELGLSADYLLGTFVVFIRDTELSHRVLANVRPNAFHFIGHPFGKELFGEHSLIYMSGEGHRELSRRFAPNFTPRALSTYAAIQQRVILAHLRRWLDRSAAEGGAKPVALRVPCRDMNLETSQTVFVGPYLSAEAREQFARDYNLFNVGLMAVPVDLLGFAFRRAKRGVARLLRTLAECAGQSKARMHAGGEPACLMDYWMQDTLRGMDEAAGCSPPAHTGDEEIGGHVFDFLFAAQDASTSSLCWAVSALDAHPDVLARVRAEVAALWSPDSGEPITAAQMAEMRYTKAVVARGDPAPAPRDDGAAHRPRGVPAGGAVHRAQGRHRVPVAVRVVVPGVPRPGGVRPGPLLLGGAPGGRGVPAQLPGVRRRGAPVVGQRYALNHLVLFVALLASLVEFRRDRTEGCDDLAYIPTIAPRDDCAVYLRQRCAELPSY
ncbi:hypothetical protein GQ55_9G443400 [Panicum hallii var. hallii]|uniref:C-22 sterol desaturase n=1 Tax=Panicum hallii var. hallii TaxID=1504633 RepID=A0A2T7CBH0_9POAL|nr:hypothetical protein GQ55_9G443400 [Panicum hallii var. hallii]